MVRRFAPGALALVLLASEGVGGPPIGPSFPNTGPPLILRLEGILQSTAHAARESGFTATSLGFLGDESARTRWLGVTLARTVGGDHTLDGKDVLASLSPFTPNLLVTGSPPLVALLREALPGTRVRVDGLVSRGARTYYLREVKVGAAAAPSG